VKNGELALQATLNSSWSSSLNISMFVDPRIARSAVGKPALADSRRIILTIMYMLAHKIQTTIMLRHRVKYHHACNNNNNNNTTFV